MPAYFYSSEDEDVINYQEDDVWKCLFAGTPEFDAAVLAGVSPFQPHADAPIPPTNADVDAERDRRILAGNVFTVTGYGAPIPLIGDDKTQQYIDQRGTNAALKLLAGDITSTYEWRDASNTIHTLTVPQMVELADAGAAWVESVIKASWDLKDNPAGIPANYTDNSHWL